ncbi:MAG: flavodoxin, partial [Negativicutes bacterium]
MTMKKLTVLLMTLAMAVLLTACGSDPAPQKTTSSGNGIVGAAEKAPEMPTTKVGGKTLVVYYSGTGRTRTAAEAIAAATQGALFELVPQQPYTEED